MKGLAGPYGRGQKVVPDRQKGALFSPWGQPSSRSSSKETGSSQKGGLDDVPQRDGGLVTYLADAVGMVRPEADPPDEGVSAFKGKRLHPPPIRMRRETSELHHLFIVLLCERGPPPEAGRGSVQEGPPHARGAAEGR